MRYKLTARLAFKVVKENFSNHDNTSETEGTDQIRPTIRLENLGSSEILEFIKIWEENLKDPSLTQKKLILSRECGIGVPRQFLSEEGKSITYYRSGAGSKSDSGLLYIHTIPVPDNQGLKSMFTIRDGMYLNDDLKTSEFDPEHELLKIAWSFFSENNPTNLFYEKIPDIRKKLNDASGEEISLNSYCDFVLDVSEKLKAIGGPVNQNQFDIEVGKALNSLGLFPDEAWASSPNISRRLTTNFRYADFQNASGNDQDPEYLINLVDHKIFKTSEGEEYGNEENQVIRNNCRAYLNSKAKEDREKVPYEIFSQIFVKDTVAIPLGERVESEILATDSSRVIEYIDLDVKSGLTSKNQEAAIKFLEALPPEESEAPLRPIATLIKNPTKNIIRKIAYPPAKAFDNPFLKIVQFVKSNIENFKGEKVRLELMVEDQESNFQNSLNLFAYYFGKTLNEIDISTTEIPGFIDFKIDDRLVNPGPVPELIDPDVDDDEIETEWAEWNPLPLTLSLFLVDDNKPLDEQKIEWASRDITWLALNWLYCFAQDSPSDKVFLKYKENNFDNLADAVSKRLVPISSIVDDSSDLKSDNNSNVIKSILEARNIFFNQIETEGLGIDSISGYLDKWETLFCDARNEFIPDGTVNLGLSALTSIDVIHQSSGLSALMMNCHPLRLRWYRSFLEKNSEVCLQSLELKSSDDEFYINYLKGVSPHGQPSLLANDQKAILIPVMEAGFGELYSALKKEGRAEKFWTAEIDNSAIDVIVDQIREYLRAHPHKKDGLSLLFVTPSGGSLPRKLLTKLRGPEFKDLCVDCYVIAPKKEWDTVITEFQEIETSTRASSECRFFPPIQLQLLDWSGESAVAKTIRELSVDISVVPNLFGDKIDVNEHTEPVDEGGGNFDPFWDKCKYIDTETARGSVAIVLKPEIPDPVLNTWSTVNVRLYRSEVVSSQSPLNTDFIKLIIRFEDEAELFNSLHKCSHWVITLDHFVGRGQIESLPSKPEIITVKEGLGRNHLYTLVVSSDNGKKFITQRLTRKLKAFSGSDAVPNHLLPQLAERVYSEVRDIAPGLILRSMGISRVTEEVLGLMVAKDYVNKKYPSDQKNGASVWISLDDCKEWFSGDRADLCRIDFHYDTQGNLEVLATIVEAKLRQVYDPHGVEQIICSKELFNKIVSIDNKNQNSIDSKFWRQQLILTIESAPEKAVSLFGDFKLQDSNKKFPEKIKIDFRNGSFQSLPCRGIYSVCITSGLDNQTVEERNGVTVVKSPAKKIISLLEGTIEIKPDEPDDTLGTPDVDDDTNEPDDTPSTPDVGDDTNKPDDIPSDTDEGEEVGGNPDPQTRLSNDILDSKYQIILDTFAEFNIGVKKPDNGPVYSEGPAFLLFRCQPESGVDPKKLREKEEALQIKLKLFAGARIMFEIADGAVNIYVPKLPEERYFVDAGNMWNQWKQPDKSDLIVPIGENLKGETAFINFSSADSPHLLIGGETGSGKSEAVNTILEGLIRFYKPAELQLLLIDPKQTEFESFRNSDHLRGDIAYFEDDAVSKLDEATAEMDRRYGQLREKRVKNVGEFNELPEIVESDQKLSRWVVVIDEYADLMSEPEVRKNIETKVKRIAQKARASGIHLIIGTQRPSADNISTTVRSNLPAQLALKCRGAVESGIIMGQSGAETLNGMGDAFLRKSGRIERIQCALFST